MSANQVSAARLAQVAQAFSVWGRYVSAMPYGSGHINDTFAATFNQAGIPVRYLFQRINQKVFQNVPALMENIARVTTHLTNRIRSGDQPDASRRALSLVPTWSGRSFYEDDDGRCWRCYLFIEKARTYDLLETTHQAREAARAFGEFQQLLADLPGPRLHETVPYFHHTRRRFDAFRQVLGADPHNRAQHARSEISFALGHERLVGVLLQLQAQGEIPERITHNDTKLNNVMLDDLTQQAICVIDLDTVMPGLALYDFGDMVRSAGNAAAEDERDLGKVRLRLDMFEALAGGYLSATGTTLTQAERTHLVFASQLITFEIGLRFLTDYLEGDIYFKTRRPDHNLDRCRVQFALVRSIEAQQAEMESIVTRLLRDPGLATSRADPSRSVGKNLM